MSGTSHILKIHHEIHEVRAIDQYDLWVFIHPICLLEWAIECGSLQRMSLLGNPLTISSKVQGPRSPLPAPCKHVTENIGLSSSAPCISMTWPKMNSSTALFSTVLKCDVPDIFTFTRNIYMKDNMVTNCSRQAKVSVLWKHGVFELPGNHLLSHLIATKSETVMTGSVTSSSSFSSSSSSVSHCSVYFGWCLIYGLLQTSNLNILQFWQTHPASLIPIWCPLILNTCRIFKIPGTLSKSFSFSFFITWSGVKKWKTYSEPLKEEKEYLNLQEDHRKM